MLWRDLKAWQVYGANTNVGKTVLSTVLCKALSRRTDTNGTLYLKPVSTGPQDEADDRHIIKFAPGVVSKCLKQFSEPISPHLAARRDVASSNMGGFTTTEATPSDHSLLDRIKSTLNSHQQKGGRFALLETAGGVLSPGPSGLVQADLYRPLRLPTLLLGDSKLGGISTTISAFESLHIRGYDVESVLVFDDKKWGNFEYLESYLSEHKIRTFAIPMPPDRIEDVARDQQALSEYYEHCASSPVIKSLIDYLHQRHFARISKLTSMPSHAEAVVWHPFRQYGLPQNVIAIDSAYQDHFETYNQESDPSLNVPEVPSQGLTPLKTSSQQPPLLTSMFDASASWWTQGLGHGNPALVLAAANAAGRYGHVMFANAVHEPALDLSYNLLATLRNPRLARVFFTDNGSTGMEVAVKMALRASCQRYGWNKTNTSSPVGILGLKGSYHGDTIGVMNCSEESVFNEKVDWHQPWGHWFSPPEVRMRKGQWQVELPDDMHHESKVTLFPSLSSIFDFDLRQDDAQYYEDYITKSLKHLTHDQQKRFGALILEPLIMGAGGMIFVDPLFQRTLIKTIRSNPALINPEYDATQGEADHIDPTAWTGLPIIGDEVFTGLYRLGRSSSSSFLSSPSSASTLSDAPLDMTIAPDISVHAKLLTGGLLPLALTTASNSIFETFLSDRKSDALLHGHSYTAHPVGCAVANKSLEELNDLHENTDSSWQVYKATWQKTTNSTLRTKSSSEQVFSFWSPETLVEISNHDLVSSCFAVGTVLALTLKSKAGQSGYSSMAAASLQSRLLTTLDEDGKGIHSRILGDVIYFMTSLTTKPTQVATLERVLLRALDAED